MSRPISEQEAAVVTWLLANASVGDGANYRSVDISSLSVVGGCKCGCASIDFEADKPARIIADGIAEYSDGKSAGLLLWGIESRITGLELYDLDPEASYRFPSPTDLRPWRGAA